MERSQQEINPTTTKTECSLHDSVIERSPEEINPTVETENSLIKRSPETPKTEDSVIETNKEINPVPSANEDSVIDQEKNPASSVDEDPWVLEYSNLKLQVQDVHIKITSFERNMVALQKKIELQSIKENTKANYKKEMDGRREDIRNRLSSHTEDDKDLIAAHVSSMTFYKEKISEAQKKGSELVKFSDDAIEAFNKRIILYLGFFFMTFIMSKFCMELVLSLVLLGVILADMLCYGYITYEDCKQAASELNRLLVFYGHLQTEGNNLVNLIRGKAPTSPESSSQPQAPTSSGSSSQPQASTSLGSSSQPPNQGILVNLENHPEFQNLGSFREIVSQPLPYRMKPKWENIVNAIIPALIFLILYVIVSIIRSYVCGEFAAAGGTSAIGTVNAWLLNVYVALLLVAWLRY